MRKLLSAIISLCMFVSMSGVPWAAEAPPAGPTDLTVKSDDSAKKSSTTKKKAKKKTTKKKTTKKKSSKPKQQGTGGTPAEQAAPMGKP